MRDTIICCLLCLLGASNSSSVVEKQSPRNGIDSINQELTTCLGICKCDESVGLVDCSNASLHKIPPYLPCPTKILYLNNNQIQYIDSESFQCLNLLEILDLSQNEVSKLDENSFQHLKNLKSLNLRENQITEVGNNTFATLNNTLQELDMSKNQWAPAHSDIFQKPMLQLKILRLEEAGIQDLYSSIFNGLSSLQVLDLTTNIISSLGTGGSALAGLNSLEELYLDNNFFAFIPQDSQFRHVRETLKVLSFVGHWRINSVPQLNLSKLEIFNVSGCALTTLANNTLTGMPALTKLDISYNGIQLLQSRSLVGPQSLTHLYLSYNSLVAFPYRALVEVPSLKHLEADYQNLLRIGVAPSMLPHDFLANLEYLSLERNLIMSIETGSFFSRLRALKTLRLSYTQLSEVPHAVNDIPALEELVFDGNLITRLTSTSFPVFKPALKSIKIRASSLLEKIEDRTFALLGNLQSIIVTDNKQLQNIAKGAFVGLNSLSELDLTNNALQTGHSEWLQDKTLESFLFSGNKLFCDCGAQDFRDWLGTDQYNNITSTDDILCYTPRFMRDQSLMSMTNEELTCHLGICPIECLCLDKDYQPTTSSVVRLDCSQAELTKVQENLPNTAQELRLDGNQLTSLNGSLLDMKAIIVLYLSNNQISSLDGQEFAKLTELKQLYLQNNKIQELHSAMFRNLTNLEELRIDSNWLQTLDGEIFPNSGKLLSLDASKNSLTELGENTFSGLGSLETLVLASNIISQIHENAFSPLIKLRVLYLAHNRIVTIPPNSVLNLPVLVNVDLSDNRFQILESKFLRSESLTLLNMETNVLASIEDDAFSGLPSLQTARLGDNIISFISKQAFRNSTSFVTLDLSVNSFTEIPAESLEPLTKLYSLYIDNNPITSLAVNTTSLNLSQDYLPSLKSLSAAFTSVENISESSFLSLVPGLESLIMNDCAFKEFPTRVLELLPELKSLVLDSNRFEVIRTEDIAYHENLGTLSLRFMKELRKIETAAFSGLPNLTSLKMSECSISSIASDAFANLTKIKSLDFSQNLLTFPNQLWFEGFDPLTLSSVSMWGNPWVCNCSSLDYQQWLQGNGSRFSAYSLAISCYDPVYFKGTPIEDIPSEYLCFDGVITRPDTTTLSNGNELNTTSAMMTTTSGASRRSTKFIIFLTLYCALLVWQ